MGERKGQNHYYPPDFDPQKHGSLNGYHGTHALRERARKLSQGILIIRFEMPYNIWCDGCKNHIGMGVRYNAEKKKVGNYYTTPIYRFRMKCHLCVNYIEMQTDPATCDYVIVCGAQRKEERWDMADNEQILTTGLLVFPLSLMCSLLFSPTPLISLSLPPANTLPSFPVLLPLCVSPERSEKEKLETDPMYKLDHGGKDKEKLRKALPSLSELQDHQAGWKDDFILNSKLRRKFRTEKKVMAEEEEKDNAVRKRTNLSIPLLPEKEEDKKLAALLTYTAPDSYDDRQNYKRKEISSRSWFSSPTLPPGSAAGSLLQKLGLQGKGAAVAKALGPQVSSPNPHSLIRRRTEGSGNKPEAYATVTRRKSDPGTNDLGNSLSPEGKELQVAQTQRTGGTDLGVAQPEQRQEMVETHMRSLEMQILNTTTEEEDRGRSKGEDCGTVLEDHDSGCSGVLRTSLVADYSDSSDSDPGV
ncbi:coiled-coil domain-containing protein 130 homolog isoform X1 [Oncorhynchus kisutch]|uniref:coiled-coil domain-containing protein 130 homolog isoform X1 n=1 Tax=Oncorhynchus kisutch TaxID=8019 RepID=UPI0012DD12FD|nr:coiled-coil domain-containing protein 130 homolog isoform X1 [Oncorhynchus kisutch]XP_031689239.1 coiled-coil domain-containing protein 130 homolog isoform X1 [Oncorhynchus kisutch]